MTADTPLAAPPVQLTPESVAKGKVVDFATGRHVRDLRSTTRPNLRQTVEGWAPGEDFDWVRDYDPFDDWRR